MSIYSLKSVDN